MYDLASETSSSKSADPKFPFWIDRPPAWRGLDAGVSHILFVFPEWHRAQKERGWPKDSRHLTPLALVTEARR